VAPRAAGITVTQSAPLVIASQESLTFTSSFTDAGALDSHIVTWNFGDGSTATANYGPGGSASLSIGHAYASAGNYTVTLTVTDDDGGVGTASTKVAVLSTSQALNAIAGYVQNLPSLNAGQKNSLTVKLNAAAASASRGDMKASNNQLNAFLNELQAYANTGKVSALEAANLRGAVYAVKGSIGTYNKFLEWWPLGI
jgi:PKD repeat protein